MPRLPMQGRIARYVTFTPLSTTKSYKSYILLLHTHTIDPLPAIPPTVDPLCLLIVTLHILSSFNTIIRRFPIQFNLANMSEDSYKDEYSDEEGSKRGGSQDPAPLVNFVNGT